jgi:hypothetical protein
LIEAFITNVDPFIRLIHKPTFLQNINHFRRGILPNSELFEYLLFIIYCFALLSLSPAECSHLGEEKPVLMTNYQEYVERGLARVNLTTTQDTSVLVLLLLYIVR